ncbi:MAG: response regulator transcription factor [Deltaproteobacteria bacterium]|nr:response regulator transcription factor [Deltaproteobacteria bacterium]
MKKESVLIVDDDEGIVDLISDRLEFEGFEAIKAYDAKQALAMISSKQPGVMILDLIMPGDSGIKVLRQINQKEETDKPSVIALSGIEDTEVKGEAVKWGAKVFFSKPCDINILVDRVKSLMKERELHH